MTRHFAALGVAAFALFALPALAGPPTKSPAPPVSGRPMGRPGMGGGKDLAAELGLTAAQKQKLETLAAQARPKAMALMQDGKPMDAAKRAKMMAMQKDYMSKMMKILTPAQRAKVQARMKAMQNGKVGPETPAEAAPGHRP